MQHRFSMVVVPVAVAAIAVPLSLSALPASASPGATAGATPEGTAGTSASSQASSSLSASSLSSASTSSASSSRADAEDFTARVRSIDHGLGIVTVEGTAPVGTSVELAAEGIEPVWTEAGPDGRWTAAVRLHVGSRHRLVATSAVSGASVTLPVELLILTPPSMSSVVDGLAGTIAIDGTGVPGATMDVRVDDVHVVDVPVDRQGTWSTVLRDLAPGVRHVAAWQYFDGTHNGGVDDDFRIDSHALVDQATVSRATDTIALSGRGRPGSVLAFHGPAGPLLDATGAPATTTVGEDGRWQAALPVPADVADPLTVTVSTRFAGAEAGEASVVVSVPSALTASVATLPDGSLRFTGSGAEGAVVGLESEDGTAVADDHDRPVTTVVERGWRLTLPRDLLPPDAVVVRQRLDGVDQGSLRLVLPKAPVRPGPDGGSGVVVGGASGTGHRADDGARPRAAEIVDRGALAYTGGGVGASALAAAVLLLTGGAAVVVGARRRARRATRPQTRS